MESVTVLKQENRKLQKQIKEGNSGKSASGNEKGVSASKVTARDVAALSVEHEMLSQQVEEMKKFLEDNKGVQANSKANVDESLTYSKPD